jgi:hypothetical protein
MVRHVKPTILRPRVRAPALVDLSPFSKALLVAASVHCALLVHLWIGRYQPHATQLHRELNVELQVGAAVTKDTNADATSALDFVAKARERTRSSQVTLGATAPMSRVLPSDATGPVDVGPTGEPNSDANDVASARPAPTIEHKINLGLNRDSFRMLDAQSAATAVTVARKDPRKIDPGLELTHRLTAGTLLDDLQHGRARGNVLRGALDSAVRHSGPTRGQAVIQVTVNASGEMIRVELNHGNAEDWAAVLRAFKEEARSKRVRVPDGAVGLKITFSVSAKVQRPSGKDVESSPVGVAAPSLAPAGLMPHGAFDLADLSNKTARVLSVRIINEELL